MNTTTSAPMVSVFTALQEAYGDANKTPLQPPLDKTQWANLIDTSTLVWDNNLFGRIEVRMKNWDFSLGDMGSEGEATWATMFFSGQPRVIELEIVVFRQKGVGVLRGKGDKNAPAFDVTGRSKIDPLKIKLDWQMLEGDPRPYIDNRQEDVDIYFLREDGMFAQVEISVGLRNKNLVAQIQEMYCGQVVRTSWEKAERIDILSVPAGKHAALVVPLYPENAYPGADYVKTFGDAIVHYALSRGATVPMSKAVVAEWKKPYAKLSEEMEKKGWQLATVLFFNLSWFGGGGYALLEDGRTCWIYWRQVDFVKGDGKLPIVSRMTRIAVKVEEGEKGLQARVILKDI